MDSGVKTLAPAESVKPRNPWGALLQPQAPCSLSSVMDEELAKKFQEEEEEQLKQVVGHSTVESPPLSSPTHDTSSDHLLAQMLQLEYDRQHDRELQAEEKHLNKQSKVKISFERYRQLPSSLLDEDEDEQESSDEWDETYVKKTSPVKSGRRKGVSPGQPTKHDPVICGRKNVETMEERFPPSFPAGDITGDSYDIRLPNHVFNTLREHSQREEHRAQRLHEKKEHSTHEHALDVKTRLMLFKMVDNGTLKEVHGCVSMGKEAAVYHADGGELEDGTTIPTECAIKVFKTTLNEFKTRDKYIKEDYRFKDRFSKQNPRKIVKMWAEKEMHNLKRLHIGGVPCPEVVLLRKHVLIMSFIGRDQRPAPQLKEAVGLLSADQLKSAYCQCVKGMEHMYRECHLVHSDLSEYNMLWFEGRVYFIDVSQSVEPSHPHGLEFLLRDCQNVSSFFTRCGVKDVLAAHDLFNSITGLGINAASSQEFLVQVRTHTRRQLLMETVHSKTEPYAFDYFFEESQKRRAALSKKQGETQDLDRLKEENVFPNSS